MIQSVWFPFVRVASRECIAYHGFSDFFGHDPISALKKHLINLFGTSGPLWLRFGILVQLCTNRWRWPFIALRFRLYGLYITLVDVYRLCLYINSIEDSHSKQIGECIMYQIKLSYRILSINKTKSINVYYNRSIDLICIEINHSILIEIFSQVRIGWWMT